MSTKPLQGSRWKRYRNVITQLYHQETLDNVQNIMKTTYGFNATKRAYTYHLRIWGVAKYTKKTDMELAARILLGQKSQPCISDQNITIGGKTVPAEKVLRWMWKNKNSPSLGANVEENVCARYTMFNDELLTTDSALVAPTDSDAIPRTSYGLMLDPEQLSDLEQLLGSSLTPPPAQVDDTAPFETSDNNIWAATRDLTTAQNDRVTAVYACPFIKRNKDRFSSFPSCQKGFFHMGDIIQHLLDSHRRQNHSSPSPGHDNSSEYDPEDGMAEAICVAISALSVARVATIDWFHLYELLFPMDKNKPQPYINPSLHTEAAELINWA